MNYKKGEKMNGLDTFSSNYYLPLYHISEKDNIICPGCKQICTNMEGAQVLGFYVCRIKFGGYFQERHGPSHNFLGSNVKEARQIYLKMFEVFLSEARKDSEKIKTKFTSLHDICNLP